jgi:hypothetical protein
MIHFLGTTTQCRFEKVQSQLSGLNEVMEQCTLRAKHRTIHPVPLKNQIIQAKGALIQLNNLYKCMTLALYNQYCFLTGHALILPNSNPLDKNYTSLPDNERIRYKVNLKLNTLEGNTLSRTIFFYDETDRFLNTLVHQTLPSLLSLKSVLEQQRQIL